MWDICPTFVSHYTINTQFIFFSFTNFPTVCVRKCIYCQSKKIHVTLGGDGTTLPMVLETRAGGDGKVGTF